MKIQLFEHCPELGPLKPFIDEAVKAITDSVGAGGKILLCGNGGSAADCEHISGELLKGFLSKRPMNSQMQEKFKEICGNDAEKFINYLQCGLPAIPLTSLSALGTAYSNDCSPELVFAQGVFALGKPCDLLIGISTSGNSENVVNAIQTAKVLGLKTVVLTGQDGGKCAGLADIAIKVPSRATYRIQEYHLPIYHYICAEVESRFFE